MLYEIMEMKEDGQGSCHTDLTFKEVRVFLNTIGENTKENRDLIENLDLWDTTTLGNVIITRTDGVVDSDHTPKTKQHPMLEQLATVAFWTAMEENENEFNSYLKTAPPFERIVAKREYHLDRLSNEHKYCMIMLGMEREEYFEKMLNKTLGLGE